MSILEFQKHLLCFQLEAKQQQQLLKKSQPAVEVVETDENDNLMWVDRFRPQSYVDLLSDEPVNRALLHWLHLWDKVSV